MEPQQQQQRHLYRTQQLLQHISPSPATTSTTFQNPKVGDEVSATHPAALALESAGTSSSSSTTSPSSAASASRYAHLIDPSPAHPPRYTPDVHWNGWGYRDTSFELNNSGAVTISGHRYAYSGKVLPVLRPWMEEVIGVNVNDESFSQAEPSLAPPTINEKFFKTIAKSYSRLTFDDHERLLHGHGHTAQEVYQLRFSSLPRVPDVVIYPGCHDHVQKIILAANEHNVVIIPYGGGTNVTQSLVCPVSENRMIVSVDMHEMNAIRWINRTNMTACIEAGITGKELVKQLESQGLTVGHEPDSMEFSTLGGWIATRASGMKKNKYGNIEDIVIHIKFITAKGMTIEKHTAVPRMSTGPDIHEMILGSEGLFGIVTECILTLHPVPAVSQFGSLIFPNFELGVKCFHEVQRAHLVPVSFRLMDNGQFQFGQALKPANDHWKEKVMDRMKKWYVVNRLKFDVNNMCAATILWEGTEKEVKEKSEKSYEIAAKYGGLKGGAENGIRGYFLTFMIAYLRDFGLNYSFMGESFETSVPWENITTVVENVKQAIVNTASRNGVARKPFISCRLTQLYETGVTLYFYFGFIWTGCNDVMQVFSAVEDEARVVILRHGGSLSHHHGVGKLRKHFLKQVISPEAISVLGSLKKAFDPNNIFASQNLIDV